MRSAAIGGVCRRRGAALVEIIISLLLSLLSTLSFVSAIFLIPAVFYFSKDVELLLSYPLKPHIIVGAKLLISVIYEYIFVFFAALQAGAMDVKGTAR